MWVTVTAIVRLRVFLLYTTLISAGLDVARNLFYAAMCLPCVENDRLGVSHSLAQCPAAARQHPALSGLKCSSAATRRVTSVSEVPQTPALQTSSTHAARWRFTLLFEHSHGLALELRFAPT